MKKIFSILLLVANVALSQTESTPAASQQLTTPPSKKTASLEKTQDSSKAALSYSTEYFIKIELEKPLTYSEIERNDTFILEQKSPAVTIPIRRAVYGSVSDGGNPDRYTVAYIFADIDPTKSIFVTINYPGVTEKQDRREVVIPKELSQPAKDGVNVISLIQNRFTQFDVEPLLADKSDALGLKYNLGFFIYKGPLESISRSSAFLLKSEGEISTEDEPVEFKNTITAGVEYSMLTNFQKKFHVSTDDERVFSYPIGFKIKPAEFEATQDLDIVDYTAKAQLVSAIPYSNVLVIKLNKITGVHRSFFPLLVSAGYSRVEKVSEKHSKLKATDIHDRIDLEGIFEFPISSAIDANLRYRYYCDFNGDLNAHLFEGGITYYWSNDRTKGVKISYVDGEAPPFYKDSSSIRLGLSIKRF